MQEIAEIAIHIIVIFVAIAATSTARWQDKRLYFLLLLQTVNILTQCLAISYFITHNIAIIDAIEIASIILMAVLVAGQIKLGKILHLMDDKRPRLFIRAMHITNVIITMFVLIAEITRISLKLSGIEVPDAIIKFSQILRMLHKISVLIQTQCVWHDFVAMARKVWDRFGNGKMIECASPLTAMLTLLPLQLCI